MSGRVPADGVHCIDPAGPPARQGAGAAARVQPVLRRRATRIGCSSADRTRCMPSSSTGAARAGRERRAPRLRRLLRFSLMTAALAQLTEFYRQAFGCTLLGAQRRVPAPRFNRHGRDRRRPRRAGAGRRAASSCCSSMPRARPIRRRSRPRTRAFSTSPIVVADMAAAPTRSLRGCQGWQPISRDGPQRLPANTGDVTAFKFRDPEGHPLELLAFAAGAVPPRWQRRDPDALFLGDRPLGHQRHRQRPQHRLLRSAGTEAQRPARTISGPEQARLERARATK